MAVEVEEMPVCENKEDGNKPRKTTSAATRQSTDASIDHRTVPRHDFLEMWYHGTGGFLGLTDGQDENGNPYKSFVLEKPTENFYKNRVAQGQYVNEAKPYISSLIDPIFSARVSYDCDNEGFNEFVKRANRNGTSLNEIKKSAGRSSATHDTSYLIMDSAPDTDRVFLSWKSADKVCSYEKSASTGELVDISFITDCNPTTKAKRRYRYEVGRVLLEEYQINDTWAIIESSPTGVNKLNVYPMFYTPTPEGEYVSTLPEQYGVACLAGNLYNADVRVNWIEVQQGHGTLVVSGVQDIKGMPDSTTNGLVLYQQGDGQKPDAKFIHLEANLLDSNISSLEKKRATLHWLMGSKGVDVQQTNTSSAESGVAKAYDYIATNDNLMLGVEMFRSADEWILEMYKLFTSDISGFECEVSYASDFFPKTALTIDELLLVAEYSASKGLEEMSKQTARNIVTLLANGESYERKQQLMDEVESTNFLSMSDNEDVLD